MTKRKFIHYVLAYNRTKIAKECKFCTSLELISKFSKCLSCEVSVLILFV